MSALIDSSSTPAQIDWSQFESLSPTNTVQLEASWLALTAKYPSSNSAPELLDEIFKQYQEPGRRHHTLPHIATMLAHLDVLLAQRAPIQAQLVKLAAWFHDVVYTLGPPRQDYSDEQASADFARRTMWVLGAPADHRHEVSRLVLSTRDHDPDPADISASALSDADLAILGAPWPAYTRYASNIRTEYSWVSEADYRSGRIGVLEGILAKDTVYKLPLTVTLYESTARANVAREIAELRI